MAEPTPGPWEVKWNIAGPIDGVIDAKGNRLVDMVMPEGGLEVSNANARRIAAAPDMEAALQMAVDNIPLDDRQPETWKAIYAALAKARGE